MRRTIRIRGDQPARSGATSRLVARPLLAVAMLAAVGGCVERVPELSPADRERLREYVGTERPSPQNPLSVELENGVSLLGYDVEPATLNPGQSFTITWYWHARQNLDQGWQLFTHVADARGENRFNLDGVGADAPGRGVVRELYQPGRWEAGQYVRDRQTATLPADWNSNRAVFYVGLWNGPHRLAIRRGDNDGENRVRAASLDVSSAPSSAREAAPEQPAPPPAPLAPPPTTIAPRAQGTITIDGRLDEPSWSAGGRTGFFVSTMDGTEVDLRARARVLWDDEHLYVGFEVADDFVQNTIAERDGELWGQDVVEIMIDPDGDGRNYFELQVSPTGQMFDTRYDRPGQPAPHGDVAWDGRMRARVHVRGTANDQDADEGYTAEIAIPWAAFAAGEPPASRPEPGGSWRMNFYVMDQRRGEGQRSAGWSPTHTNTFHAPARFGRVTFAAPPPVAEVRAPSSEPGIPTRVAIRPEAAAALREHMARRGLGDLPIQPPAVRNRPQAP